MTHKERILELLERAGDKGISSRVLYREFMGRGAARIKELREEGHRIDSEERDPIDPKFCIYKLIHAGRQDGKDQGASVRAGASVASNSGDAQRSAAPLACAAGRAETPDNPSGSAEGVNPSLARAGSIPDAGASSDKGVGVGAGTRSTNGGCGDRVSPGPSVDSGESRTGGRGEPYSRKTGAANATPGPATPEVATLPGFEQRPLSAFTDDEMAA